MARIRTIKPEFPQSESMGRVSRDARLLFIQLWTLCDDSGRTRAASRMLASLLFPYDDGEDGHALTTGADVERWLAELESEGCIALYEHEGTRYLQVCKWLNHQKIDKPSASRFPEFDESSRTVAKAREPSSGDLGPRTLDQDLKEESPKGDLSPEAEEQASDDEPPGIPKCPVQKIVALYHKHLPELAPVKELPEQSVKMLRTRWRSDPKRQSLEWWEKFFVYVKGCPFLMGEKTEFTADLLWLVRPTNFAKVVNGNYERR